MYLHMSTWIDYRVHKLINLVATSFIAEEVKHTGFNEPFQWMLFMLNLALQNVFRFLICSLLYLFGWDGVLCAGKVIM